MPVEKKSIYMWGGGMAEQKLSKCTIYTPHLLSPFLSSDVAGVDIAAVVDELLEPELEPTTGEAARNKIVFYY